MADLANSILKTRLVARRGPGRAGLSVLIRNSNPSKNLRIWTDIDGTQRPVNTMNIVTLTASGTLLPQDSGAKVVFNSTTSLIATLPQVALGLEYEFFVQVAATSGVGHLITPNATDGSLMFAKGTTPLATKGSVNTQATGAMGDGFYVWSDGTNWFGVIDAGTWARQA